MEDIMKKLMVLFIFFIINVSFVFGQNYILYYSGDNSGFITIQKESSGKITITPKMTKIRYSIDLTEEICPILPELSESNNYSINEETQSITIDGNTTTRTYSDGSWNKTVVDGNTISWTSSDGWWHRKVVEGETETVTQSDGRWYRIITDGNTRTGIDSYGFQFREVVEGNKTTRTNFEGTTVIIIVDGNTTTWTDPDGRWQKKVIEGNTITITDSGGRYLKTSIDKKGNNIYIFEESRGFEF
jgi:hypothetical protein